MKNEKLRYYIPVLVGLILIIALVYGFDRRCAAAVSASFLGILVTCVLGVLFTDLFKIHGAVMAYSGGYIALLMVFMAQGTPVEHIFNDKYVAAEIIHTVIGSFGLVGTLYRALRWFPSDKEKMKTNPVGTEMSTGFYIVSENYTYILPWLTFSFYNPFLQYKCKVQQGR